MIDSFLSFLRKLGNPYRILVHFEGTLSSRRATHDLQLGMSDKMDLGNRTVIHNEKVKQDTK